MLYEYKCFIDRIVDGDTIDVTLDLGFAIYAKERVRLSDVDTPEIWGKLFVEKWLEARTAANCFFVYTSKKYNRRGKYGRSFGNIEARQPDGAAIVLNEALIGEGWGHIYEA